MADHKRLLVIAWYFPPIGGPGTQRTSKYCKYLPSNGWSPVVIAGVDPSEHQDETLLSDLGKEVTIHRIPMPSTRWQDIRRWLYDHRLGRVGTWFGYWRDFPDIRRDWAEQAVELAVRLHAKEPFDAIYTTSYPYSAHFAGFQLKQRLKIPWVADFRDAWADNEVMLGWLPRWVRKKHNKSEERVAVNADALTFAHPDSAKQFNSRFDLSEARCLCLTNGFDHEDYSEFEAPQKTGDEFINMVHTGSFYGDYSPQVFLDALTAWEPPDELKSKLAMRFVGGIGNCELPNSLHTHIDIVPRVSQTDALREQMEASLLLLVFDRRSGISHVPGKLFGYMAANRPIFCVSPADGSTAEFVRRTGTGWVVDCDDTDGIVEGLNRALLSVESHKDLPRRDTEAVSQFRRDEISEKLAGLLDMLAKSAVPNFSVGDG